MFKFYALFAGVCSIVLLIMCCILWGSDYIACKSYESITQRDVKFSLLTGCYVKQDESWIPKEEMTKK